MPDPQCGPINEPEAEYKAVSVDINFDEVFSHQSDEERIGLFLREHLSEEDATIFEVYMNSDMKSIIDFCRIMADEFEIFAEARTLEYIDQMTHSDKFSYSDKPEGSDNLISR